MRPRKRCPFCRCLFFVDGRVAKRQWACTKDECQRLRRQRTQKEWRETHPQQSAARACRLAIAAAKAGEPVAAPRGPPVRVERFPWEELRDEIRPEALVIAGFFVRLLVGLTRDEIRAQVVRITAKSGALPADLSRDETAPRAAGD